MVCWAFKITNVTNILVKYNVKAIKKHVVWKIVMDFPNTKKGSFLVFTKTRYTYGHACQLPVGFAYPFSSFITKKNIYNQYFAREGNIVYETIVIGKDNWMLCVSFT